MAFVSLANERGIVLECVIFPKIFERYKHLLIQDQVIIIEGKLDRKNDKPTVLAEKIYPLKPYNKE